MVNSRELAYKASLASYTGKSFIQESLSHSGLSSKDLQFAKEISYGTIRMSSALDYLANQLAGRKLKVKPKERLLIQMAIYQYFFMSKVPIYAIVNETISLARKYCHSSFVSFLNAILRKLESAKLHLPQGNTLNDISIRYSYPADFIQLLLKHYDQEKVNSILESGNQPSQTTVRIRNKDQFDLELITEQPFPVGIIKDTSILPIISGSKDYYIQNVTQATLIGNLCKELVYEPASVIDLCSSPGGKALAVQDYFPQASIHANDISEEKLQRIRENCKKYDFHFKMTAVPAEKLTLTEKFDIVILDVPCSNSGVLNRRPEARWRITEKILRDLNEIQIALLKKAMELVTPHGEVWYLTCSIIPEENELLLQKISEEMGLKIKSKTTISPKPYWDGGFAASLFIP